MKGLNNSVGFSIIESIVLLNHSIMVKLPLGVQSFFKSLPFADFSILCLFASIIIISIILLINLFTAAPSPCLVKKTTGEDSEALTKTSKNPQKKRKNKEKTEQDKPIVPTANFSISNTGTMLKKVN